MQRRSISDFSEFSYGYALTENLITWTGMQLTAAPVFPSLIAEGQTGGGYDLNLKSSGIALFLQFKLSKCIRSRRATEYQKGQMTVPFYRMALRPRTSRQHELLLDLEKVAAWVYYVAPAFDTLADLNDAYLSREVLLRSIMVAPSAIGRLPDNKSHHVAYEEFLPSSGQAKAVFCSTPRPIHVILNDELVRNLTSHLPEAPHIEHTMERLQIEMLQIVQAEMSGTEYHSLRNLTLLSPLYQVAYLSHVYFGCEMYLVRRMPSTARR